MAQSVSKEIISSLSIFYILPLSPLDLNVQNSRTSLCYINTNIPVPVFRNALTSCYLTWSSYDVDITQRPRFYLGYPRLISRYILQKKLDLCKWAPLKTIFFLLLLSRKKPKFCHETFSRAIIFLHFVRKSGFTLCH